MKRASEPWKGNADLRIFSDRLDDVIDARAFVEELLEILEDDEAAVCHLFLAGMDAVEIKDHFEYTRWQFEGVMRRIKRKADKIRVNHALKSG